MRFESDSDDDTNWRTQASEWLVKVDRGLTPVEEAEFNWLLRVHPQFKDEFDKFSLTQKRAQGLPIEIARGLLNEARASGGRPNFARRFSAIAAALAIGSVLLWWMQSRPADQAGHYQIAMQAESNSQTRALPDGSLIRLNSNAALTVSYSSGSRRIALLEGEAHFEVAKDPLRPFIVTVDQVDIIAVGTAFNVRRASDVNVYVTEGIVRISTSEAEPATPELIPAKAKPRGLDNLVIQGQRAKIVAQADPGQSAIDIIDAEQTEIDEALQWHRSLLTINAENLEQIAASFERKTGYKLTIADPALKTLQIGGRFPSSDVEGFLRILGDGYGIPWRKGANDEFIVGESK